MSPFLSIRFLLPVAACFLLVGLSIGRRVGSPPPVPTRYWSPAMVESTFGKPPYSSPLPVTEYVPSSSTDDAMTLASESLPTPAASTSNRPILETPPVLPPGLVPIKRNTEGDLPADTSPTDNMFSPPDAPSTVLEEDPSPSVSPITPTPTPVSTKRYPSRDCFDSFDVMTYVASESCSENGTRYHESTDYNVTSDKHVYCFSCYDEEPSQRPMILAIAIPLSVVLIASCIVACCCDECRNSNMGKNMCVCCGACCSNIFDRRRMLHPSREGTPRPLP